jgi:hypothetical protein
MRVLSNTFINNLVGGLLNPILERVKNDSTLCLEIREGYINIYYRGGNIIEIREKKLSKYDASFDVKYISKPTPSKLSAIKKNYVLSPSAVDLWVDAIPLLKEQMDFWFAKHPKSEREFQQLIVRENNFQGPFNETDYYIIDIEYATNDKSRFDLIAARWPSTAKDHKVKKAGLSIIEMKYMEGALSGKAGMKKHIDDLTKFFNNPSKMNNFKKEMQGLFTQKHGLGLIKSKHTIEDFHDVRPEVIFIFANHKPASKKLYDELTAIIPILVDAPFDLKIATSNFMGYGLYLQSMYDLNTFLVKFASQIKTP